MIAKSPTNAEEFEMTCHDFGACELVRGEVLRLSPAGFGHSRICGRAFWHLAQWAETSGLGRVVTGEAGLVVETDPDTVRGADVAYFSYKRLPKGAEPDGFSRVAPELVIEVVGKGQGWSDMVDKAGEYLRMGVDRVWVIDPKTRRVHVFRADEGPRTLDESDELPDEDILPGFSCRVAQFFED